MCYYKYCNICLNILSNPCKYQSCNKDRITRYNESIPPSDRCTCLTNK